MLDSCRLVSLLRVQSLISRQGRRNADNLSLAETNEDQEEMAFTDGLSDSDEDEQLNPVSDSPSPVDRAQFGSDSFGKMTGFLGKASMVRMIEEVGHKLTSRMRSESREAVLNLLQPVGLPDDSTIADPLTYAKDLRRAVLEEATYYMTDLDHSDLDEFGGDVDPLDVPPLEQAEKYLNGYFTTLHPLFPIVLEPVLRAQHAEFRRTGFPPSPGAPLQATFNLIYALGALHAEMTASPTWDGTKSSHVIYFIRARLLSFEPLNTLELPELHHTQLAGLFGMYFLASNQLNRGWLMIGRAVRCAQNRGLHLINESPSATNAQTELEARTWHSICSLERLACFVTGKPAACNGGSAATRPPQFISSHMALQSFNIQFPEEAFKPSSTDELDAFCVSLELDEILGHTLAELYAPNVVLKPWETVQKLTYKFNKRIANWRSNIDQRLLIHDGPESELKADIIQRVYLALRYFSLIITVNRPSFSDYNEHKKSVPSQTDNSRTTDSDNARKCVSAARDMIRMFVAEPNVVELYRASPWWCILHYLVQAATIIVMEISFHAIHFPDHMTDLKNDALKAISCLQAMAEKSEAAQKAANTLSRLFNLTLLRIHRSVTSTTPSLEDIRVNDLMSEPRQSISSSESPFSPSAELSFTYPWSPIYQTSQPDENQQIRLVAPHPVYSPTMMWTPSPPRNSPEEPNQSATQSNAASEAPSESSQSRHQPARRGRKERKKG